MMPSRAVVLFAHGSRDPLWSRPIEAAAERMRKLDPSVAVENAYLELMKPDLPAAVRALVASGANQITVVPMFLGVGRHARHDLPQLMAAAALEHPEVRFKLQQAIGEDTRVLDLMAAIALE